MYSSFPINQILRTLLVSRISLKGSSILERTREAKLIFRAYFFYQQPQLSNGLKSGFGSDHSVKVNPHSLCQGKPDPIRTGQIYKGRGLAYYSPWAKSGPLPVFINKVFLEPSHVHLLTYRLWQLKQQS